MPQVSAKQTRINNAKKSAPKVPGDTCPSIDYVQTTLSQISDRTSDEWVDKQIDVANGVHRTIARIGLYAVATDGSSSPQTKNQTR